MNLSAFKRPRLYYGWIVLAGLTVTTFASNGMVGPHRALFIKPMTGELGFGQGAFGLAQSASQVAGSLLAPIRGRILDRYGARVPLAVVGLLTGVAVVLLSQVREGWQLVVVFGFIGLMGLQAGQLFTAVPLASWFVRKRGRVMAIVFLGTPVGVMLWSPLVQILINEVGWRSTWMILGTIGGLTAAAVSILIVRRRPEDMGLLPDGDQPKPASGLADQPKEKEVEPTHSDPLEEYPWTRSQAMHTITFWGLSAAFGLQMFAMGSLVTFRIPYFVDKGIDRNLVALGLSTEGVSAIFMAGILGFVLERVNIRRAAGVGFLVLAFSALVTMGASQTWHMFVAFFIFGMGVAFLNVVQATLWPAYFGRANLGAIRGMSVMLTLVFAAGGAPTAGFVHDITGSYLTVWSVSISLLVLGALLLFVTPAPRPRAVTTAPTGVGG